MQSGEGLRETFVVASQAAEAGCPCKAFLHPPSSWQEHESAFGFGVFNHFEPYAVFLRGFRCILSGIALIDVAQFNAFSCDLLHLLGQFLHLGSILLVGNSYMERRK